MAWLFSISFFLLIFWVFDTLSHKKDETYRLKHPIRVIEASFKPTHRTRKVVLDVTSARLKGFPEKATLEKQLSWFGQQEAVNGKYRLFPLSGISCKIDRGANRLKAVHFWLGGHRDVESFSVDSKSVVPARLMLKGGAASPFEASIRTSMKDIFAAFGETSVEGQCTGKSDLLLCYPSAPRRGRIAQVLFHFTKPDTLDAVTVEWGTRTLCLSEA